MISQLPKIFISNSSVTSRSGIFFKFNNCLIETSIRPFSYILTQRLTTNQCNQRKCNITTRSKIDYKQYFKSNYLLLKNKKEEFRKKNEYICVNYIKFSGKQQRRNIPFYLIPSMLSFSFGLFSSSDNKDEEEDSVVMMIKRAVLAIQREELEKAEQLLHLALKSAQELNDINAVTYIYDLMANLAMQRNELEKAEKLFIDVLKRFINRGLETDNNAVVEVSLKLASIYANLGELNKAVEGFKFCIETQETKLNKIGEINVDEDTLVLWAMSQDWYARFLLSIGKYELAKQHFLRAYDVCIKVMGPEDPQTAVLLNDLGSVCSLLQNYEEAIGYLLKAIEIGKKINSEDLSNFYINLGTVYLQKGLSKEAQDYCNEGVKIAKKSKNEEAFNEGTACLNTVQGLQNA